MTLLIQSVMPDEQRGGDTGDEKYSHLDYANQKYFYGLDFICAYVDENYMWFPLTNRNLLFRANKITWEIEYVGKFLNENDVHKNNGYYDVVKHNDKLYFVPFCADGVGVYDIILKKFYKIDIPYPDYQCSCVEYTQERKFFFGTAHDGNIFLIPNSYPAIVKIDCETENVTYCNDFVKHLNDAGCEKRAYFYKAGIKENKILMYCFPLDSICEFDMDTLQMTFDDVHFDTDVYVRACFDGKNYWLPTQKGADFTKYNPVTKEITKINVEIEGFDDCRRLVDKTITSFSKSFYYNGYAYFVNLMSNIGLKIDVYTNEITEIEDLVPDSISDGELRYRFWNANIFGDDVYLFDFVTQELVKYDLVSKKSERRVLGLDIIPTNLRNTPWGTFALNQLINQAQTHFQKYSAIIEGSWINLPLFIEMLNADKDGLMAAAASSRDIEKPDADAGKKIYNYVKKIMTE